MITFVNAKINIGLEIVSRRPDGYHNLRTIFYPIGRYAGLPENPEQFCDILEVIPLPEDSSGLLPRFTLDLSGRKVDCPPEKNLVYRAADLYFKECASPKFRAAIRLEKHLPDGAGMGGGSADAAFTLKTLAAVEKELAPENRHIPDDRRLEDLALRLGADCPFFIRNSPAYAEGVGEILEHSSLDLSGYWAVVVKPHVSVSTREAFAGITPRPGTPDLKSIVENNSPSDWRGVIVNDFSQGIYKTHPEMSEIHKALEAGGAQYVSMTGSGSAIFSLWTDPGRAARMERELVGDPTIERVYLLKL